MCPVKSQVKMTRSSHRRFPTDVRARSRAKENSDTCGHEGKSDVIDSSSSAVPEAFQERREYPTAQGIKSSSIRKI